MDRDLLDLQREGDCDQDLFTMDRVLLDLQPEGDCDHHLAAVCFIDGGGVVCIPFIDYCRGLNQIILGGKNLLGSP